MKLYVISFLLLSLMALVPSRGLSQDGNDLESARRYVAIANGSDDLDTIKFYSKKAYDIVIKSSDLTLLADCANNLAFAYASKRLYDSAIIYYKRHYITVSEDTNRKKDMARTLGNLGICYKNTGKYIDMWNCFRQSKTLFEQLHDTSKVCWTTIEMGKTHESVGLYQQAREYYFEALALATARQSSDDIARCHFEIGNITLNEFYNIQSDSTVSKVMQARDYILQAIDECYYSADNYADTLRSLGMLALSQCYMTLLKASPQPGNYADSCRHYLKRFITMKNGQSPSDSLVTETMKAMLLLHEHKYKDAIPLLENAAQLPVGDNSMRDMTEVYKQLSIAHSALGNYKEAYTAKRKYNDLFNKLGTEENMNRTANFAAQMEINAARERQNNETKYREAQEAADKEHWQKVIRTLMECLVGVILIVLAIILSLRKKRRLNKELNDRNDQLLKQRDIIAKQKNDEQEAQSIILSSVEYASKIQSLAIGSQESVTAIFPENFVYYRPRNIVSGDWYMATALKGHRIMIEADCTGHGIPGALLCMLGVSAVKDITYRLKHSSTTILPGLILDEMRVAVKKALNKNVGDSKAIIDDGMDMSIVVLPPEGDRLLFGGANQSAILISSGEAIRLKGDANPIGNYVREKEHFTTTEMPVRRGDAVYLFSDGIQDQTGGEEYRKYSLKKLTTFLAEHYALEMKQQMAIFEQDLETYAGEQPQVDDRTLVGIRI
ncbi:MAG: tetratricopeptide repeat protein [Bacteroidales bacterium]|nr:tetratricopeptide repeat protein [Bacteroidales bacterium]